VLPEPLGVHERRHEPPGDLSPREYPRERRSARKAAIHEAEVAFGEVLHELVYRHDYEAPVTRSVKRLRLEFAQGEHRVRIRVNQGAFTEYGDGRWQASLRFRTVDDDLSDVRGR
jgi:hypothetical protein